MKNAKLKVRGLPQAQSIGFTLIELLVVIAIISLLSSIILASLGTARAKAADAAIKSNLVSVRTQAELQFQERGCYTNITACSDTTPGDIFSACTSAGVAGSMFTQTNIAAQIAAAKLAGGSYDACASTPGGRAWAVAVVLRTARDQAWCVDSTGASKQISRAIDYSQGALLIDISPVVGTADCLDR